MPEQLIATAGAWFFIAIAAQGVAAFVEQAGAPRSPQEDPQRKRMVTLVLMLASLLGPGLLLLHGFLLTAQVTQLLRIELMAAPVLAILLGSLFGAIFGALVPGAAALMRTLALPVALIALAITLYVASPSIVALANGLQAGAVELPVRPL